MKDEDPAKPLADLLEPGSTVMVGTGPGDALEFRPLTVARVSGDRIEILMDTTAEWAQALRPGDPAHVTLSDTRSNHWSWLVGTCSVSTDPALIDELWNPMAGAYFDDGRDTPGIAVLTVDGDEGRYWTSPSGRIGSLISMVKAAVGSAERSGEHGDVDLQRRG